MKRLAVATFAFALAVAADRASAAFDYPGAGIYDGGDCAAIAAQVGAAATWVGEFAGDYYDDFRQGSFPVSARGCFRSQSECRRWQGQLSSNLGRGGIRYMRCTPGWRSGY